MMMRPLHIILLIEIIIKWPFYKSIPSSASASMFGNLDHEQYRMGWAEPAEGALVPVKI